MLESDFDEIGLKELIVQWKLPRWVAIKEGDNELPLDLKKSSSLHILWGYIRKKLDIKLIEWLHFNNNTNDFLKYTNQFIVSYINKKFSTQNWKAPFFPLLDNTKRISSWLRSTFLQDLLWRIFI